MCGIIYAIKKDKKQSAVKSTLKKYQDQKTRGTQGFGFLAVEGGQIKKWGQSQTEEGITEQLGDVKSAEILFHHRYPTSTPNVLEGTHPIKVSNDKLKYDYYVVHNGVISNASTLRDKYEKEGYVFNTVCKTIVKKTYETQERVYTFDDEVTEQFNDSEAFAIDIAKAIEDEKTTIESMGSIAFIVFQHDKVTGKKVNTFFGRNIRNPLVLFDSKDIFTLSSQGSGKEVKEHTLYCINTETAEVKEVRHLSIGPEYTAPAKTEYGWKDGKWTKLDEDDEDTDFFKGYGKKHSIRYEDTIEDDATEFDRDYDTEYAGYNGYPNYDIDVEQNTDGSASVFVDNVEEYIFKSREDFKSQYENITRDFDALNEKMKKNKNDRTTQALLDSCALEVEILSEAYYQITVAFDEIEKKTGIKSPIVI